MASGRSLREAALITAATGLLVVGLAAAVAYNPTPAVRLVGFLLFLAAFPGFLLLESLGLVTGYWSRLAALWFGLAISGVFFLGFLRWLGELRRWRRANLALRR
jgi:hypothetical protein